MPQLQMKDPQEKHVVSRKPLQNSMNKQNSASQSLQNCPVCLKDNKKRVRKRRSRGKGKDIQVVENLKDIGVDHDLQVEPLVSSKGLTFHRRPGYGQAGTKCIVKANHFLAELPDKDLNHYHVTITPEPVVSSRRLNRAIMAQLVKLYRESDLGMRLPAYDGRNSLYTAGLLPFTSKEFSITLADEGHNINDARQREFKVTIKFVARADLQHLQQFLAGKVADTPQEALQVLDIVLRELSTQRYMSIGRSFYSPDIRKPQRLGEGLQSWRGFYQSLRPTQMGLSLNIDMSSASFMEPLPVIEFVVQILGKDILMRPLSDADRIKVANDPANPPSRTNIFVVTHTRKNGTFVSEEVRQKMIKINEIVARDPSSKHKDLDHDPVAEVFGKDGRGRVLGLDSGVSKTTLTAAAPYKRKAKEVERSKLFQSQIDDLKQQVIDRKKTQMEIQSQVNAMLAMQGINQGAPTQISTNSLSDQLFG